MRSPTSSEHVCPTSGLLCGRLLLALVDNVLRPGGWESMCRLMCHCVRHISLDNKYDRSVKTIHSSRSRWRSLFRYVFNDVEQCLTMALFTACADGGSESPPPLDFCKACLW